MPLIVPFNRHDIFEYMKPHVLWLHKKPGRQLTAVFTKPAIKLMKHFWHRDEWGSDFEKTFSNSKFLSCAIQVAQDESVYQPLVTIICTEGAITIKEETFCLQGDSACP